MYSAVMPSTGKVNGVSELKKRCGGNGENLSFKFKKHLGKALSLLQSLNTIFKYISHYYEHFYA